MNEIEAFELCARVLKPELGLTSYVAVARLLAPYLKACIERDRNRISWFVVGPEECERSYARAHVKEKGR